MQTPRYASLVSVLSLLGAVLSLAFGSSWAKSTLFPAIGAEGTTTLRVGFSAALMLLLWRPWRWHRSRSDLWTMLGYGVGLAGMNLFFYMALQRIPFGVAVAIEFSGPLSIALFGSRRPIDFLWIGLAVLGLGMLLPLGFDPGDIDPLGVIFALTAGAFWAGYILFGKRLGHLPTQHAVPMGMTVAALLVAPIGIVQVGAALLSPWVLLVGLGVAIVSSAIPILLEMVALKRLAPQTYGVMVSMEPAVAALVAWAFLNERLSPTQWLAIILVMSASMGCAWTAQRRR